MSRENNRDSSEPSGEEGNVGAENSKKVTWMALPGDVKEACDAYSEKLRAHTRLWSSSMIISAILILHLNHLTKGLVTLPFKMGETDPTTFFALSCWVLSGLWFGTLIQYAQSVRANKLLHQRVLEHKEVNLAKGMGILDFYNVFHASGPGHLSPLLSAWSPEAKSWNWLHIPLKMMVSATTFLVPPYALVSGVSGLHQSGASLALFVVVAIPACIVIVSTLLNLVLLEFPTYYRKESKKGDVASTESMKQPSQCSEPAPGSAPPPPSTNP